MKARKIGAAMRGLAVVASIAIATPMMATSQGKEQAESQGKKEAEPEGKKKAESQNAETSRGGYDAARFAEQARELGLTPAEAAALQKKVDEVVAKTGGTQIAINKVLLADGSGTRTIPLPVENRNQGVSTATPEPYGKDVRVFTTDPKPTGGEGRFDSWEESYDGLIACDLHRDGWYVSVYMSYQRVVWRQTDLGGADEFCEGKSIDIPDGAPVWIRVCLRRSLSDNEPHYCSPWTMGTG